MPGRERTRGPNGKETLVRNPDERLAGNRLFDYTKVPGAFEAHMQFLRMVRDKSLHQYSNKNSKAISIPPEVAGELLQEARKRIQNQAQISAGSFSPAAWLWYLRRLPRFFFDPDGRSTFACISSGLAETISANPIHSSSPRTTPLTLNPLTFETNPEVLHAILSFCGQVLALRTVHRRIRTSSKEVHFLLPHQGLPTPSPTPSQIAAMRDYDERNSSLPMLSRVGTILWNFELPGGSILMAWKDDEGRLEISDDLAEDSWKLLLSGALISKDHSRKFISTKFNLTEFPIPNLSLFRTPHISNINRAAVARTLMILLVIARMVKEANPAYFLLNISQTGYILEDRSKFIERVAVNMTTLVEVVSEHVPGVELPETAESLVAQLEQPGVIWPVAHGPIVRVCGDSLIVDIYAASMALDHALTFEPTTGSAANFRAKHFEDQVQGAIDGCSWAPPQNSPLRLLRNRKRIKRADGSSLTDIDAIATKSGTLIIVECKSMLIADEPQLGLHKFIKNRAEAIECYVRRALLTSNYLNINPLSPIGSYDFSAFKTIVVVVCTPGRVYVEEEMIASSGPKTGELLSTREILPGLRAAVSFLELISWLETN